MSELKEQIRKDLAGESKAIRDYKKRATTPGITRKERSVIYEIRRDELDHHRLLKGLLKKMK